MNSFQIGLIAIGAFVIAVLFLWQWWQSRRVDRAPAEAARDAASAESVTDVPGSLPRVEPTVDLAEAGLWTPQVLGPAATGAAASAVAPAVAPAIASAPATASAPTSTAASTPASPRLAHAAVEDEAVDFAGAASHSDAVGAAPEAAATWAPPAVEPSPAPAQRARLVSEWPFDERLHVHASIVSLAGGPFDAAPFVAAAGRAAAWVRLFRQSPWEPFDPSHTGSVQQLALALPLASRAGPIEAADIDAWRFVLTELSNAQACEAHFFGFRDGPARAAELDSFLAAVDIIPVAYLVKKDSGHWPGTRLRGTLEANGFRLQSDGRFAYHEVESDAIIFHAVDGFERPFTPERLRTENITALRCTLEPVRLAQPLTRFDVFRQSLRALSKLLDADLKTSEGAALGETEFTAMRDEVKTAMEALAAAGIEPGSEAARALFG